jgi:hypothetical protein
MEFFKNAYPKRRKIPKSDFVLVENFTDVNAPWILKGAEEKWGQFNAR